MRHGKQATRGLAISDPETGEGRGDGQASQLLLGAPPPREWFQNEEDYGPADDDPNVHRGLPDVEPPVRRRR